MTEESGIWSATERQRLDRLGDVLIPADGDMPSAGQSDPDGRWLDRACAARPDLAEATRRLLGAVADLESLDALVRAEAVDGPGVAAMVTITAGRYYMNPKIRELIGYPGQGGRDPGLPEYGWDRAADMLERVLGRGQAYRDAP